jgi:hypothetical protein
MLRTTNPPASRLQVSGNTPVKVRAGRETRDERLTDAGRRVPP